MDSLNLAQQRYTAKAYDSTKKIPAATFEKLLEILRLTPSSTNAQPWHFLIADSAEAKAKIIQSMTNSDDYNIPKIQDASHLLVLCTLNDVSAEHLAAVTRAEMQAGRYTDPAAAAPRQAYVDLYRQQGNLPQWSECQTHIALGQLLWAAAAEGIDSTAIGGFRSEELDRLVGLNEKGMHSSVVVTLGYRSPEDRNADKPKSRLPFDEVFSRI